jgi:hypothetical protein
MGSFGKNRIFRLSSVGDFHGQRRKGSPRHAASAVRVRVAPSPGTSAAPASSRSAGFCRAARRTAVPPPPAAPPPHVPPRPRSAAARYFPATRQTPRYLPGSRRSHDRGFSSNSSLECSCFGFDQSLVRYQPSKEPLESVMSVSAASFSLHWPRRG